MISNLLYSLIFQFSLWILALLRWTHPKLKQGFALRKKQNGIYPWLLFPRHSRPIWIHCSSGEYEYAKPVIRELKKNHPKAKILVTYFSPSVVPALKKSPEVDFFCPLPWDLPSLWSEFIEHHQPQALLVARTDLWPMMLNSCRKHNIPSLLFSRVANSRKSRLQKFFENILLQNFTDIFCVSTADAQELSGRVTNSTGVYAAGDTRYDQCLYRIHNSKPLKPLKNFSRPTLIAGSTWPADEDVLIPAFHHLIKKMSLIIAPHEPTPSHIRKLSEQLRRQQLDFCLYSQTNQWDHRKVLIIDEVGVLADLYSWCNIAFVGNSMTHAVHSVMEPLAQGCLTLVGPCHSNSREALDFQNIDIDGIKAVQVVQTTKDLIDLSLKNVNVWQAPHKAALQKEVRARTGASLTVLKWIENQVQKF